MTRSNEWKSNYPDGGSDDPTTYLVACAGVLDGLARPDRDHFERHANAMSSDTQDRALAYKMGEEMVAKLGANQARTHWSQSTNSFLIERLYEEVEELITAVIEHEGGDAVWAEAADVANFAAMIADNV